jgi:hypothetical protein
MVDVQGSARRHGITSTQTGAVGELMIAAGLIVASGGRLAPFKPVADDDGIDLLVYDKLTRQCAPLQVKSRTRGDGPGGRTVQFDVQRTTYSSIGGGLLLGAMIEGLELGWVWLVPMPVLDEIARKQERKLTMVASTVPDASDRWAPYRHRNLASVAQQLLLHLQAQAGQPRAGCS